MLKVCICVCVYSQEYKKIVVKRVDGEEKRKEDQRDTLHRGKDRMTLWEGNFLMD